MKLSFPAKQDPQGQALSTTAWPLPLLAVPGGQVCGPLDYTCVSLVGGPIAWHNFNLICRLEYKDDNAEEITEEAPDLTKKVKARKVVSMTRRFEIVQMVRQRRHLDSN